MKIRIVLISLTSVLILGGCKSKKRVTYHKKKKTENVVTVTPKENKNPNVKVEKESTIEIKKEIPKNSSYSENVYNYIKQFAYISKFEMKEYGIPASITLAQGILESGAGQADLVLRSNNHFGIKCHSSWKGERVYHDDDTSQECFRKYKIPENSFRDHSLFLAKKSRYKNLFSLRKNDYKSWAKGLKKAGYATDPKYPSKLINIIETYRLYEYDNEVLETNEQQNQTSSAKEIIVAKEYIVKKGDTLYSISRKYQLSVDDLKKLNNLSSNSISVGQVLKIQ
ncbi:MAG: glucosaminidase domain-containing protein [Flavobacteriales bacterium]